MAFEDLPDEQRHLPSESDKARAKNGGGLAGLLAALDDDSDDASSDGDDIEDNDIEDEEEDEDDVFEEAVEIYDGSEELSL